VEGPPENGAPNLILRNSQIYNSATTNLWAREATIEVENSVLGSAGNSSLSCTLGGNYTFIHTTITNFWSNGFRSGSALEISNFETDGQDFTRTADLTKASFSNCIVDGNTSVELSLRSVEDNAFNFSFTNCILKFTDTTGQFTDDPLYNFENTALYSSPFINAEPDFIDTSKNDFRIGPDSEAIGNANVENALMVPLDILGNDRIVSPDIGAYQHLPELQN
jgi:hypothetical protein